VKTKDYEQWLNGHWEYHTPEAIQSTLFYLASCAMQEAGEVFDVIKKPARTQSSYNPELSPELRAKAVDECGDVLAYLTRFLNRLDSSVEEALEVNHLKLVGRYGEYLRIEGPIRRDDVEEE
jgi:NTP pyrophosphatase (non-canonical NTP hydrolase)